LNVDILVETLQLVPRPMLRFDTCKTEKICVKECPQMCDGELFDGHVIKFKYTLFTNLFKPL